MALYDVPAPAKLNLFLHVLGRRDDGYHALETLFRFIDLADVLHFERRQDGVISCEGSIAGLAPEDDLVVRAARLLQHATGCRHGAHVACEKRIPAGAGLGGGSSDAASTLIALNRLWDTGLDRAALMALGLQLGADVPVFIYGRSAFAEGVGERLQEVILPQASYLVLHPPVHVSTARIFGAPELTRNSGSVKMSVFTGRRNSCALPEILRGFRNDFQAVACSQHGRIARLSQWLGEQGLHGRMTGTGSSFYVEFPTHEEAIACQREITGKIPVCVSDNVPLVEHVWACKGLQEHPLHHWVHS